MILILYLCLLHTFGPIEAAHTRLCRYYYIGSVSSFSNWKMNSWVLIIYFIGKTSFDMRLKIILTGKAGHLNDLNKKSSMAACQPNLHDISLITLHTHLNHSLYIPFPNKTCHHCLSFILQYLIIEASIFFIFININRAFLLCS